MGVLGMRYLGLDKKHSMSGCAGLGGSCKTAIEEKNKPSGTTPGACGTRGFMNQHSVLFWYRVLRTHYHWTMFQAVRYALWLAR
jgi:hypothetical protein